MTHLTPRRPITHSIVAGRMIAAGVSRRHFVLLHTYCLSLDIFNSLSRHRPPESPRFPLLISNNLQLLCFYPVLSPALPSSPSSGVMPRKSNGRKNVHQPVLWFCLPLCWQGKYLRKASVSPQQQMPEIRKATAAILKKKRGGGLRVN